MIGDISYDLIDEDDTDFDEGCYRIENGDWHVFIINKRQVDDIQIILSSWNGDCTGVVIRIPESINLNRTVTEKLLADWFGLEGWNEVRGPDSMDLR